MLGEIRIKPNLAWGISLLGGATNEEVERAAAEAAETAAAAKAAAEEAQHADWIAAIRIERDAAVIAEAAAAIAEEAPVVRVIPFPGFVIKTRKAVMDDRKIFINVFHHTSIKDEHAMLTFVPFTPEPNSPTMGSASPTSHIEASETVTPLIYLGVEPSTTEDKEGYVSLLYNVLVSSKYFERTTVLDEKVHITHPTSVNKVKRGNSIFILQLFLG